MAVILLIDDHPEVRSGLRRLLQSHGHRVIEADNGAAALDLLLRAVPDLIVSDVQMPVMNGCEFRSHQLADDMLSRIPLVFVSAHCNQEQMLLGAPCLAKTATDRLMSLVAELTGSVM